MGLEELKNTACEDVQFVVCGQAEYYGIAPGRVEVLGNHTDYNDGFILSAAIDRHVVLAGRRTNGEIANVYSDEYERLFQFNTTEIVRDGTAPWCDYIMGVVDQFTAKGYEVGGFEAAIAGDIPLGAGLSSSAALEVAVAKLLCAIYKIDMTDKDLALLCQKAENEFVGMNCGILDQWSSVHGKEDHLIFLDCRDLSGENLPLGKDVELVIADTKAKHELVEGTYNRLRKGCHKAAEIVAEKKSGITHLRDISVDEFAGFEEDLPEDIRNLARHVVFENDRVLRGAEALKKGNVDLLGQFMLESHRSSRDYFGNSCAELDTMVNLAEGADGCLGCRLSGGGFGGATVNLVMADKAEAFAADLAKKYEETTGIAPEMYVTRASDGARSESVA